MAAEANGQELIRIFDTVCIHRFETRSFTNSLAAVGKTIQESWRRLAPVANRPAACAPQSAESGRGQRSRLQFFLFPTLISSTAVEQESAERGVPCGSQCEHGGSVMSWPAQQVRAVEETNVGAGSHTKCISCVSQRLIRERG